MVLSSRNQRTGDYAYVILKGSGHDSKEVRKSIISTVVSEIGPIAKPDVIQIVSGLLKPVQENNEKDFGR